MDEKVEQIRSPKKMNEATSLMSNKSFNKLNISEINLEDVDVKKMSPRAQQQSHHHHHHHNHHHHHHHMTKSPSTKASCLCSPTTHAGSFRCRQHRSTSLFRGSSVGSNLFELARKSGPISMTDSLETN